MNWSFFKMDDPEPDPNTVIFILAFILLTLFSFVVTLGTSAVRELSEKKIHDAAEDGDKKSRRLEKLISGRPRPADTAGVSTALCSMLGMACALLFMLSQYAENGLAISGYENTKVWLFNVAVPALVTVIVAVAVFSVFGTLLPRRIGKQNAEALANSLSGFLVFAKVILFPLTIIPSEFARIMVKTVGGDPHIEENPVTEDEILLMVDEGEESGVLEEIEKEMINNIFEFGDLTADEVMTHRTDITAVEADDAISNVITQAMTAGCSRLPVYDDELDNIIGILYVKDLLKYVGTSVPEALTPRDIMREAMFIPESKKCRDLFSEMTEKHLQMVIVSDEYGGVAGIVTIEDLIESIVGNIQDEFDDEEEEIEQVDEDRYNIDGLSAIDEVEELLGIEFPDGEYETVAGYMISVLGRIPDSGEHPTVKYDGFCFTVEEMDERRIVRLSAERLPEIDEAAEDSEKENANT